MTREEAADIIYRALNTQGYGRALHLAPDRERWLLAADKILEALK